VFVGTIIGFIVTLFLFSIFYKPWFLKVLNTG
jgi:hypothetical protein